MVSQEQNKDKDDNVRVVVRCRPMNDKEVASACSQAVSVDERKGTITVKSSGARSSEPPKTFTFDRVFGPDSKQVDVYNDAARPIVESVLEGYNGMHSFLLFHIISYGSMERIRSD